MIEHFTRILKCDNNYFLNVINLQWNKQLLKVAAISPSNKWEAVALTE